MSKETLNLSLARGNIRQVCVIVEDIDESFINTASSTNDKLLDERTRKKRFEEQSWDALKSKPVFGLVKEYEYVFTDKVPDELPSNRVVCHEIDVLPGTKYCITRHWQLPREQVVAIYKLFAQRHKLGMCEIESLGIVVPLSV